MSGNSSTSGSLWLPTDFHWEEEKAENDQSGEDGKEERPKESRRKPLDLKEFWIHLQRYSEARVQDLPPAEKHRLDRIVFGIQVQN